MADCLQGDRGEAGSVGPLGPKGDGFPGPMVRKRLCHLSPNPFMFFFLDLEPMVDFMLTKDVEDGKKQIIDKY